MSHSMSGYVQEYTRWFSFLEKQFRLPMFYENVCKKISKRIKGLIKLYQQIERRTIPN